LFLALRRYFVIIEHMHYFCAGGCQGQADVPGVCQDTDCPDFGLPLHECDCPDGEHNLAIAQSEDEEDAE
jgi:hypothetical protein